MITHVRTPVIRKYRHNDIIKKHTFDRTMSASTIREFNTAFRRIFLGMRDQRSPSRVRISLADKPGLDTFDF